MPRMNDITKLVYALEHIAHLQDLVEGNEYEKHLRGYITSLEVEFNRQLANEKHKRGMT